MLPPPQESSVPFLSSGNKTFKIPSMNSWLVNDTILIVVYYNPSKNWFLFNSHPLQANYISRVLVTANWKNGPKNSAGSLFVASTFSKKTEESGGKCLDFKYPRLSIITAWWFCFVSVFSPSQPCLNPSSSTKESHGSRLPQLLLNFLSKMSPKVAIFSQMVV